MNDNLESGSRGGWRRWDKKDIECLHQKKGTCKYGERCEYKHLQEKDRKQNETTRTKLRNIRAKIQCRYGEKCSQGEKCEFKHKDIQKKKKETQEETTKDPWLREKDIEVKKRDKERTGSPKNEGEGVHQELHSLIKETRTMMTNLVKVNKQIERIERRLK